MYTKGWFNINMSKSITGTASFELVLDYSPLSKATDSFILKMLCL